MDLSDIQAAIAQAEAQYQQLATNPPRKQDDKVFAALLVLAQELRLLRILLAPQLTED